MRAEHREQAQLEVTTRVLESHQRKANAVGTGDSAVVTYLETLINDTIYHERRRLEREKKTDSTREEWRFYQSVGRELGNASERRLGQLLEEVVRRFVQEVTGNFDDRVYQLSTSVIPAGLSLMLKAASPRQLTTFDGLAGVRDHIEVQGEIDHVRALQEQGTLMVMPTHSSHLDSIVLGYAAHFLGLPPLLYGAGLNLFTNPFLSFFMNNLGAYRVDRKKQAGIYKEVLKEYATVALELGYDNLFFPGGTRSRSGAVESKLKRGLMGTAISAYVNNLRTHKEQPKIFIVPCTISYKLVLEAETLIDDHLKEVGKARYIIEDDEFSKPRRVLNFMSEIASLDSRIVITFSPPRDIVGNLVDLEGNSLDPRGRVVETESYVSRAGEPIHDAQRDRELTNEIANCVVSSFHDDNVVMSTNVVGYSLMRLLERHNRGVDRYRLLRTGGALSSLQRREVIAETDVVLNALAELQRPPRLGREVAKRRADDVLDDALKYYATYHTRPAAHRRGERIFHEDRNLLLYYANRLRGYDLGRRIEAAGSVRGDALSTQSVAGEVTA